MLLAIAVLLQIGLRFAALPGRPAVAGSVWLGGAAALALIGGVVVLANLVLRLREAARALDRLAAVALIPVEVVLFPLETAWLALVALLALVLGPLAALAVGAGRLLRILLWPLIRGFDVLFPRVQRVYPSIIRAALRQPGRVLAVAAVGMVLTVLGFTRLDSSLIPEVHQGEFDLEITLPVGTPLRADAGDGRPAGALGAR